MKERIAYLEIDGRRFGDNSPNKDFVGLNVGFDVNFTGSALVSNASGFQLYNLNDNDIKYITTNTTRWLDRQRTIKCFAGYSGNVKQIFGGQILDAYPTGMPETSVKISCFGNIANMGKHIERTYTNPLFITLLNDAATDCGLVLNVSREVDNSAVMNSIFMPEFSFTGSANEFLQRIESEIISRNVIREDIMSFTVANDVLYVYYVARPNNYADTPEIDIPLISAETGMVGIPSLTRVGVNIQMMMDVSVHPGQTIKLESKRLPNIYNTYYNIINIRHHGTLYGKDWYSDLECNIAMGA